MCSTADVGTGTASRNSATRNSPADARASSANERNEEEAIKYLKRLRFNLKKSFEHLETIVRFDDSCAREPRSNSSTSPVLTNLNLYARVAR